MSMSNDDLLWANEVDRRAFLKRAAMIGALVPGVPALLAGLNACGGDSETGGGNKVLGFAHPDATGAFYPPVSEGAHAEAKKLGWTIRESQARGELDEQVAEIQIWIAEGVDALVILALDLDAMGPLVRQAHEADIKVISYANPIEGADGSILFADPPAARLVGTAAGNWINEKLDGEAKVAFMGDYSSAVQATRLRDAKPALLKVAPDANVVYEGKGTLAPETNEATRALLQRHPDLKVVICAADDGAIGSSQAFLNADVDVEDVWVAGYDGSQQALEQAITGTNPLRAVAALDLVEIGQHVVSVPNDVVTGSGPKNWAAPYVLVDSSDRATGERLINSFSQ